jgi:hypothetical protein
MQIKKFFVLFLCSFSTITLADSATQSSTGMPIMPGVGYSSATQQTARRVCFNMHVTSKTTPEEMVKFDNPLSVTDLEKIMRTRTGLTEDDYLRGIQETPSSSSLSYYRSVSNTINMEIIGNNKEALTPSAREYYEKLHQYFGEQCGDNYITSYKQGAALTISLMLHFQDAANKQRFEAAVGRRPLGDVKSLFTNIQQIARANHIDGSIGIQAYQQGGMPERLSFIFDPNKPPFCELQNMVDCISTANSISAYANVDFPHQISFEIPDRLYAFGIGLATYEPITKIGLNADNQAHI